MAKARCQAARTGMKPEEHAKVVKIMDQNKCSSSIHRYRAAIPDTRGAQSENLSVENWEEIAFPGSAPRIELQSRPLPLSGFFSQPSHLPYRKGSLQLAFRPWRNTRQKMADSTGHREPATAASTSPGLSSRLTLAVPQL